jgi:hypothetical protein
MKAKLIRLYHEVKCGKEWIGDYPADEVSVKLRKWRSDNHTDVVLETEVVVDGKVESRSCKLLAGMSDATAIRYAIAVFDELVAAHPAFSGTKEKVE